MPNPNHCIVCDKPTMNEDAICDSCKEEHAYSKKEPLVTIETLKNTTIKTLNELASKPLSSAENILAMTRLLELIIGYEDARIYS